MSRLLRVYPRAWRDRYGDEVAELLMTSGRPGRDRVDLVLAAGPVWLDRLGEKEETMRAVIVISMGLVAIGLVTTAWATTRLADGVIEIPGHWWSTLAAAPLVVGLVALTSAGLGWFGLGRGRRRRHL